MAIKVNICSFLVAPKASKLVATKTGNERDRKIQASPRPSPVPAQAPTGRLSCTRGQKTQLQYPHLKTPHCPLAPRRPLHCVRQDTEKVCAEGGGARMKE